MRLSCDPIIFFKQIVEEHTMSLMDWFPIASDLGLDGTEIQHNCLHSGEKEYLDWILEGIQRYGLQISQFIASPDFTNPDETMRSFQVSKMKTYIDLAQYFGAHCVRITAGQEYPNISRDVGIGWIVTCFTELLEYTVGKGIWLAYENHYKDYFWEHPDFSRDSSIFIEIVDRLKDTALKVNFDCSNPIVVGQDPVSLLKLIVDRVVHVHCNDRVALYQYDHAVVGEGLVNIPELFGILKQHNYDGWLSIEYNGKQGIEGLKKSINYVRTTWESV
jgi:sugar phosphate isomerase/epimerase